MNLKKRGLGALFLTVFALVGCGKKSAPKLSFEETLQVFNQKNEVIRQFLEFMYNDEDVIASELKANVDVKNPSSGQNLALNLDVDSTTDGKTKDTESQIAIDANLQGFGLSTGKDELKASTKLKFLLKEYQLFFQLADLKIDTDQIGPASMVLGFAEPFKGKWLTLDNPELKEVFKLSKNQNSNILKVLKHNNEIAFYTGVVATEYDGYPAWKVDFDMDQIKKFILENIATITPLEGLSTGEQQEMRDNVQKTLDNMEIQNVDAYFVIRSADEVDYILKNADILIEKMKINIQQAVEGDKAVLKGTLTSSEQDDQVLLNLVVTKKRKNTYDCSLEVSGEVDGQRQQILKITGLVEISAGSKGIAFQPKFNITFEKVNIDVDGKYSAKKVKNYNFEVPEGAQDLEELLGSFGLSPMGAHQSIAVDDDFSGAIDLEDEARDEDVDLEAPVVETE